LSNTIQIDRYYNPKDRNLTKTDELLRIREEAKNNTLIYKGPRTKFISYRDRPKFEFSIDDSLKRKFLSIYGDLIKTIKKERIIYQFKNLIFSVDKVVQVCDKKDKEVGEFVEFRVNNNNFNKKYLENTISKLGFDINKGIRKSYFDLVK
jgi:predicted adenylyl cyclase CyaB